MSLRRALDHAANGDRARALDFVDAALAGGEPDMHLAGAHVLRLLALHDRAFEALKRAAEEPRLARHALWTELEWMLRLGRLREAREVVERSAGRAPHARFHARLADDLASRGCEQRALGEIDRAMALAPASAPLWVARAKVQVGLGATANALDDLAHATSMRDDAAIHIEAANVALECGAFAMARRDAECALTAGPMRALAHALLGRLALFVSDVPAAMKHAEHAIGCDPSCADGWMIRGAAHALAGEHQRALASLEVAIVHDPSGYEARLFRAEVLLKSGRPLEGLAEADRAVALARGPSTAGLVTQQLCRIATEQFFGSPDAFGEVLSAVEALCPSVDVDRMMSDVAAAKEALTAVLVALEGNRTTSPTTVIGGSLVRVPIDPGPRFASRHALQRIAADDDDEVLGALTGFVARYPRSALPRCHRGEARLWLGDYAEARMDLTAVLSEHPGTRWAYIGLTAVEMLADDAEAALDVCARGVAFKRSEGPGVFVHRGEALRRLGRFEEARADLERACALHPSRIAAPINLALNRFATGEIEAAHALYGSLLTAAESILADAAQELSIGVHLDEQSPETARAILERALHMMRGNRSSTCVTYFVGGHLRSVVPCSDAARARAMRERDLDRASRVVAGR